MNDPRALVCQLTLNDLGYRSSDNTKQTIISNIIYCFGALGLTITGEWGKTTRLNSRTLTNESLLPYES